MIIIGGAAVERELKGLVDYASQREHWYRPGASAVPGDCAPYVRRIEVRDALSGTVQHLRVVFTFTQHPSGPVFRHASISEGDRTEWPSPISVFTLCKFLGFTGTWKDWLVEPHPDEPGVMVVGQPLTAAELGESVQ